MKKEYNFTNSKPNPYAAKLRKQISIRLNVETIAYFKKTAQIIGIPYQKLINIYLSDCVAQRIKPSITWK
ncbi:MAG: BrnA antitoxin family protein [Elusimicrobiaceae bacterium]|nr:BrnA antitoxin family protein [Elusimicrobiaceae bacterium]